MLPNKLHPGAEKDLQESIEWYAERDTATATRFVEAVHETISALAENSSSLLDSVGEIRTIRLRKFPFQLVFRWNGRLVEILAISHTARRQGYWRSRAND